MAADVLRQSAATVGEPCVFHPHDSDRNTILLAPTSVPIRRDANWCLALLPYKPDCSPIAALLPLLPTACDSLRSCCGSWSL